MSGIRSTFFENLQQGYDSLKHAFKLLGGSLIGEPHYKSATGMVFGIEMEDGRAFRVTLEYMPTLKEQQEYLQEQSASAPVNPLHCKYCGQPMQESFCNAMMPHPVGWHNFSGTQVAVRAAMGDLDIPGAPTYSEEYLLAMKAQIERRIDQGTF